MSMMYEVNAVNAAMVKAAEICRQEMPEGEKINAVLACFAGMKPVDAAPVVYAKWESRYYPRPGLASVHGEMHCPVCETIFKRTTNMPRFYFCPNCGAKMGRKSC